MQSNSHSNKQKPKPLTRDERLKAALKANMGRRKAQAKARSAQDETTKAGEKDKG
ncbi:hypothetical protein SAMN05444000_101280 [Shimia gijangensis]|uniref:Uncharacterized protein n=1 Tax=Shimia gijangensis TaxID=1470563 RepID=A0A1M6BNI6_9RHOB|nr:hypothetical protein SAMN05444000_101280 [Shimia gijangensis]